MSSHSRDYWKGFFYRKIGYFLENDVTKNETFKVHNQLFDLSKDPSEKNNLAEKYPGKVLELKQLLKETARTTKKVEDSKYLSTGASRAGVWATGW